MPGTGTTRSGGRAGDALTGTYLRSRALPGRKLRGPYPDPRYEGDFLRVVGKEEEEEEEKDEEVETCANYSHGL